MSHAAPMPIGRLSQKMPRHVQYCAKKPPSAGPTIAETPQTRGDVALDAAALGGLVEVADDRRGRRQDRAGGEPLHAAEDDQRDHAPGDARTGSIRPRNPATPKSSTGLRPNRSESRP